GVKQRAAIARAKAELGALAAALEEYKRLYGDYPQLGEFAQVSPLTPANANGPGLNFAQAKLFNCLTGVYGPRAFNPNTDRLNGPNFLDVGRFTVSGTLQTSFLIPAMATQGGIAAPAKVEQNAGLLDPWGRYYLYYYKNRTTPNNWQAPGYVLYSAGPRIAANGTQTPSII